MSDIPKCPKCGATGAAGSNTTDCGCSLFGSKKLDNFEHESPIRAFTTFDVCGHYAIGKGFRPSMQHLAKYLDAMQRKEYWWLVQILFGDTEPTLVFRHHPLQSRPYKFPFNWPDDDDEALERFVGKSPAFGMPYSPDTKVEGDPYAAFAVEVTSTGVKMMSDDERAAATASGFPNSIIINNQEYPAGPVQGTGIMEVENDVPDSRMWHMKFPGDQEDYGDCDPPDDSWLKYNFKQEDLVEVPLPDDPVNPKHYAGTACAEIGELLSANSYQVLKYNWRLGGKDNECVEIDKSIWYLDREIALFKNADLEFVVSELPDYRWFDARLEGQPQHTVNVARALISWNRYGRIATLKTLRRVILSHRLTFECPEFGRQQEP